MSVTNGSNGAAWQWSLPRGRLLRRVLRKDPTQEYLLYLPSVEVPDAPVMVSVHGISRNAQEQARVFAPYCERFGIVLVAPVFTREFHVDYQRLGRAGRGAPADLALHECLAEVASLSGTDVSQLYLFGFSGGGQFAHRYLMAHPHRVVKALLVAPGWYTFPDHTQRYPYGIRNSRKLQDLQLNPEEFLQIPVEVLVGSQDIGTANLRMTDRTVKQQGENRCERARRWVAAMRTAALAYNIEPAVSLSVIDNVDHSFTKMCQHGALVRRVFKYFFNMAIEPATTGKPGKGNGRDDEHVPPTQAQLM
jgi:pimeloyl-ACP methyl ester carboxylesterase